MMITWKASRSESKKQYGNQLLHLITLSALASTLGGIVRPICLAVFRFDDKLELCRLLDGQIGRLCAL
jgi:hypothetical protein